LDRARDEGAAIGLNRAAIAAGASGLPVYFGRCFGFLHQTDRAASSGRGVVLCGPNGYEALCVNRPWGRFAAALAGAGLPTLRFDYPGSGDAPEADEDPERVRAWLDGIREAVAFLRRQTGVTEVALVGLRFGATLAAVAAQEMAESGQPVTALALLAPVASGEAYCKELRVLSMMARARAVPGTPTPPGLEAAGFYYTPCTLGAMKALAPAETPVSPASRILIMDRADGAGGLLAEAMCSKGCDVETVAFPGYSALMRDAITTEYPEQDFRRAIAWLRKGAPAASGEPQATAIQDAIAIPGGRERPVFIGTMGLFGILTEPEATRADAPAMLILNTGANHRIGTNRLSVQLARRLVQEGVTVLRFDACCLGDSPSASDRADQTILDETMIADVRQAVDFLAARGHREIVVNGLCAGGWLAYQATLADPRITGQILLNLQNLWLKDGVARSGASNREYFRLIRKKETWIRLMQGDLQLRRLVPMLTTRFLETIAIRMHRGVSRVRGAETLVEQTRRELDAVAARGAKSAFVYVLEDPGLDEMEVHFGRQGRDLAGAPGVSIIFIDQGDHLFSIKSSRDHLLELMAAQFSQGRFAPMAARVAAAPRGAVSLQSQTA
jgi:pimeloyl-ACP methyl ester carboxylesterase